MEAFESFANGEGKLDERGVEECLLVLGRRWTGKLNALLRGRTAIDFDGFCKIYDQCHPAQDDKIDVDAVWKVFDPYDEERIPLRKLTDLMSKLGDPLPPEELEMALSRAKADGGTYMYKKDFKALLEL